MVEQKYFKERGQTSVLGGGKLTLNKINNNSETFRRESKIAARGVSAPAPLVADRSGPRPKTGSEIVDGKSRAKNGSPKMLV